jgi:hypothetical protein
MRRHRLQISTEVNRPSTNVKGPAPGSKALLFHINLVLPGCGGNGRGSAADKRAIDLDVRA